MVLSVALTMGLLATASIYPDGHFDHVFKATTDNFDAHVKTQIDAGKTLFAPAWNEATSMFKDNKDVAFADINLSEQQISGAPFCDGQGCNPGAGGWPTIRYFNKETGTAGKPYTKKTGDAMCTELGNMKYMQAYIEEAGSTSLCSAETGAGCGDKEKGYIAKWKEGKTAADYDKQITRLQGMTAKAMKPELMKWVTQRLAILKQLAPKKEEL